jgi:hypothetical protein
MPNFVGLKTGVCVAATLFVLMATGDWADARTTRDCQASYGRCRNACYGPYGPRDKSACVSNCTRKYSDCIYDIYTRR